MNRSYYDYLYYSLRIKPHEKITELDVLKKEWDFIVNKLTDKRKIVMEKRYIKGQTFKKIAEDMGTSIQNIRVMHMISSEIATYYLFRYTTEKRAYNIDYKKINGMYYCE